jgi:hypothetical protein
LARGTLIFNDDDANRLHAKEFRPGREQYATTSLCSFRRVAFALKLLNRFQRRAKPMRFLILLFSIATVWANPIQVNFAGTVNNDPYGVFGNAAFTGQYTFDSNMAQVLNTPNAAGYAGAGGVFSMAVMFTGTVGGALDGMRFTADALNITVENDFPGPLDEYLVTGTSSADSNLTIEITLSDFTGTAFSNTQLPLVAPNPADFSAADFALFDGDADNPMEADGTLNSAPAVPSAPEPSSLALCSLAFAVVAGLARRTTLPRGHGFVPRRAPASSAEYVTEPAFKNNQEKRMRITFFALFVILALSQPATLFGVDGVVLIDQNKAMAGNVTPGDTPGFPVTISQPGSYRLDSNLTVPDANTTAVQITASNVTLDLNGFSIVGITKCNYVILHIPGPFSFSCAPGGGSGVGVEGSKADLSGIKIMNGTIQGMGSDGVMLYGDAITIEKVSAVSNGGNGFHLVAFNFAFQSNYVHNLSDSVASRNQLNGANVDSGTAMRNSFVLNGGDGLLINFGSVIDNQFWGNQRYGLEASTISDELGEPTPAGVQYRGNFFSPYIGPVGNYGIFYTSGGYNTGQNFCSDSICN